MNLGEQLLEMFESDRIKGIRPSVHAGECLERLDRIGGRAPSVVVAEPDPARFLAAVAAALAREGRVFLGNPQWAGEEWNEVGRLIKPDIVFGDTPLDLAGPDEGGMTGVGEPIIGIPTGGSSGKVRFAVHDETSLAAAANGFCDRFGGGTLHCLSGLPFFHVSGLMPVVRAAVSGGTASWVSGIENAPAESQQGTTILSLVPTRLARWMRDRKKRDFLRGVSAVLVGGAPLSRDLREAARRERLPLAPSYGMTETAAAVCVVNPDEFLAGDDSSGKALPHVRLSVKSQQPSAAGRILVATPALFRGYVENGGAEGAFRPEGETRPCGAARELRGNRSPWPTEDTGRLDDEGRLFVTGRLRPLINSGGEKVDPGEVERALIETGIAAEAHVAGLPDPEWGETVVAVYVPGRNSGKTTEELRGRLKSRIAAYKAPKRWIAVDEIPRDSRGKVDLRSIRTLTRQGD